MTNLHRRGSVNPVNAISWKNVGQSNERENEEEGERIMGKSIRDGGILTRN